MVAFSSFAVALRVSVSVSRGSCLMLTGDAGAFSIRLAMGIVSSPDGLLLLKVGVFLAWALWHEDLLAGRGEWLVAAGVRCGNLLVTALPDFGGSPLGVDADVLALGEGDPVPEAEADELLLESPEADRDLSE